MNAKGSYLILNVTVKNNGTKAITVSDSDFKLVKDKTIIQNTAIVAVGFILAFTALGLITFEKQDL